MCFLSAGISSCTGYLKDPEDEYQLEELQPGTLSCELNKNKSFEEIIIKNGSGSYYVSSSDDFIVQASVEGNKVRILGMRKGNAFIKVMDVDGNNYGAAYIEVRVQEDIERRQYSTERVYVQQGKQRLLHPEFDGYQYDWMVADQDIALTQISPTEVILNGLKEGRTTIEVSKDFWTVQKFDVFVMKQLPLLIDLGKITFTVTAENLEKGMQFGTGGVKVGNGKYELHVSDESVLEAWIYPNRADYNNYEYNSAGITYCPKKPGTTTVTVTDLISGEQKVITVTVILKE